MPLPVVLIGQGVSLLLNVVIQIMDKIAKIRAAAQQAGEWTPAQEAEFQERKREIYNSPAWQIEP